MDVGNLAEPCKSCLFVIVFCFVFSLLIIRENPNPNNWYQSQVREEEWSNGGKMQGSN